MCDVRVPKEKRKSFEDFALIIKHAVINYETLGRSCRNYVIHLESSSRTDVQ